MLHTHTPGRSRVNPERQEEEKSGHTTGKRPKTAQGGRGTDGPPEPTYTAKRTWPKQRTHLNPTTRYGEARGERLGTKWGTSWCQTKNKTISKKTGLSSYTYCSCNCATTGPCSSQPQGHKRLTSSIELDAQYVSPHQVPKRPHLQEEDMPVAFCRECHVELQMRKLQW